MARGVPAAGPAMADVTQRHTGHTLQRRAGWPADCCSSSSRSTPILLTGSPRSHDLPTRLCAKALIRNGIHPSPLRRSAPCSTPSGPTRRPHARTRSTKNASGAASRRASIACCSPAGGAPDAHVEARGAVAGQDEPQDARERGKASSPSLHYDRRQRDQGPPAGVPERRRSMGLKPPCPWCGASTSRVIRSIGEEDPWRHHRQDVQPESYHRSRQCLECRKTWPTVEQLDRRAFARQLAKEGKTLADLGLDGLEPSTTASPR